MSTYHVVFGEAVSGYREVWFPALMFGAGLWLIFFRVLLRRYHRPTADQYLPAWSLLLVVLAGIGVSGIILKNTYEPHARLRDALNAGSGKVIEGVVVSVRPGDPGPRAIATDILPYGLVSAPA
jgi:hypothetical protein